MFVFDEYRLDPVRRELWHGNKLVTLEPQVFDLLVFLIDNRDRVVSKDDLVAAIWSGRSISDSTVTSRINFARKAIGDSGRNQRRIRTVPRTGFRFVGDLVDDHKLVRAETTRNRQALPNKPSIAVLPFRNLSGDPEQEYFSDGMAEEILTALSRLHWLFVIGRNSTFMYKGAEQDVRRISSELRIRYVLEGSVRNSGSRVRVTSQLLDTAAGQQIWSERYDRDLTDIFLVQDEITASVIGAIEPALLAAEGQRATQLRNAREIGAWDEVARGLSHFWRFTERDSAKAIEILSRIVDEHPEYAPAHSMLACALLISSYLGWTTPGSNHDLASSLACRAVSLDDTDPWGHLGLGICAMMGRLTNEAVRCFSAALDLNPNFATAVGFSGFALVLDGRTAEALQKFEQAKTMSPRDPFNSLFYAARAVAHYFDGRFDEAVRWARQSVQFRPDHVGGYRILAASLAQLGRRDEAEAVVARLQKLTPDISVTLAALSVPYTARSMEQFLDGLRKAGLPD